MREISILFALLMTVALGMVAIIGQYTASQLLWGMVFISFIVLAAARAYKAEDEK